MKIWHSVPAYNMQIDARLASQLVYDSHSARDCGWTWAYRPTHGCVLHQMRNRVIQQALEQDFDVVFMQDSDTYSPMQGGPLVQMINAMHKHDAAACYAIVTLRNFAAARANVEPVRVGEVYEVEKAGSGIVAIDLAKIRPWYADYNGPLFVPICTDRKQHSIEMGMDVYFSRFLRTETDFKPALKIIADGRIPTTHINATAALEYDGLTVPGTVQGEKPPLMAGDNHE